MFFLKNPNLKKKHFFFVGWWGGGGGGGEDGWTDEQAQTNMPLQLLLSPSKSYRPVIKRTVLFQKQ